MDRSNTIILISATYTVDAIGNRVESQTYKTVFCNIRSVSGTEWYAGGQKGINPQYKVTMFRYDYSDELVVNIGGTITNNVLTGGTNYAVYRTYMGVDDTIELYLERREGV